VAEILSKAGLSTRAFYRHFGTKEDVIRALYQRDATSFGGQLATRVASAADPVEALRAWVDGMLGLAYDRRRADRMSALGSPMVARVIAGSAVEDLGVSVLLDPLLSILEAGAGDGSFPDADAGRDVHVISAITWDAIGRARSDLGAEPREEALERILRFSRRGLGDHTGC
jgi:AcrR family transcriptional regulator